MRTEIMGLLQDAIETPNSDATLKSSVLLLYLELRRLFPEDDYVRKGFGQITFEEVNVNIGKEILEYAKTKVL